VNDRGKGREREIGICQSLAKGGLKQSPPSMGTGEQYYEGNRKGYPESSGRDESRVKETGPISKG